VLLAELGPQPSHVDVDRAGTAVVLVAPHARQQLLAREHLARMRHEELEQLVLHVREVERLAADARLIRLEVEHEVGVLRELRTPAPPTAEHEVTHARLELLRVERSQAEVVEEIFAVFELVELTAGNEQQDGLDRAVALAQRATHRERTFGIFVGADDRADPAVGRLVLHRERGVRHGLPTVTREVERLREERRRRIRIHQKDVAHRIHPHIPQSVPR
jgi:hypothetical protein